MVWPGETSSGGVAKDTLQVHRFYGDVLVPFLLFLRLLGVVEEVVTVAALRIAGSMCWCPRWVLIPQLEYKIYCLASNITVPSSCLYPRHF